MSTVDRDENPAGMSVRKRDGSVEHVQVDKIVRAVARCADGLDVDVMRVATRTISGLHEGITTAELDRLSIATAAALTAEEPDYSRFAARLLARYVDKEVRGQDVYSFSQSIKVGAANGIVSDQVAELVAGNAYKLDLAVEPDRDRHFEYFGLRTVYDRYLIKDPVSRLVTETPQYFFLRVACGLADTAKEAIAFYELISSLAYLPSTPTLFNSGTDHSQMSSCYLLDSPSDDLASIYERYSDVAKLSKHAGGIGVSWSRIRSTGSHIQGTNGLSNGVVPWLKTLDSSVAAVNQGGKRKGAACVYLETWHADVEDFLALRDNTGDDMRRTHHLNLANWVPDEFMHRVEADEDWSLFDPKTVPHLVDLYGDGFAQAYRAAEADGLAVRSLPARRLYERMLRTLAETGNGWMTFKDASNAKSNQTRADRPDHVVHLSNLCTEIVEVTDADTHAVCNLGSINLGALVVTGAFDFARLRDVVRMAVTYLDRVIDRNFYPTPQAASSNDRWRPVGLGQMGLQDVFFKLRLAFDSPEALELSTRIAEEMYYAAVERSVELADELGAHPAFPDTKAAQGTFQFELWDVAPSQPERWEALRARMVATLPGLEVRQNILDPGFSLTLRPMRYPGFYEMYKDAIANTWTVEEVDFSTDLVDLRDRLTPEQHHLVKRLVAFFATGDSIVGNNLVLNLYRHINSPEARMYLGRQLYEEMLHVQFYLTLLDNYVPDLRERQAAFAAVESIPSIKRKADFCFRWMGSMDETTELRTIHDRRRFLLHLICFAACVEGLFFFAAFSYVYFLRDRGLLKGLADGTNWVFRDESMHMNFGFEVVRTVREEEPELWTDDMQASVRAMLAEAIECELAFARDMTGDGIPGLSLGDIGRYLEYVADQRLAALGIAKAYGTPNPFAFMELQDVQSLSNFFERGNASYQIGVTGNIDLDAAF